jgi:hypothetical protein
MGPRNKAFTTTERILSDMTPFQSNYIVDGRTKLKHVITEDVLTCIIHVPLRLDNG